MGGKSNLKPMRIYLSGPIRLIGANMARRVFDNTRKELVALGHEVVTPFENGLPEDAPYEEHMAADMKLLEGCDAICMLLNWQESEGAKRELAAAEKMKKDVIYQKKARGYM